MKVIIMSVLLLSLVACSRPMISACPPFPETSKDVASKIKSLHDPKVDSWFVKIYKLKLQLQECTN